MIIIFKPKENMTIDKLLFYGLENSTHYYNILKSIRSAKSEFFDKIVLPEIEYETEHELQDIVTKVRNCNIYFYTFCSNFISVYY